MINYWTFGNYIRQFLTLGCGAQGEIIGLGGRDLGLGLGLNEGDSSWVGKLLRGCSFRVGNLVCLLIVVWMGGCIVWINLGGGLVTYKFYLFRG